MKRLLAPIYNRAMHLMAALPLFPPFPTSRMKLLSAQGALNTVRLIKDLGITPKTIIDVGARESTWSCWLTREWPDARLISIEPDPYCKPNGEVIRVALGTDHGVGSLLLAGDASRLVSTGTPGSIHVEVVRFDSLKLKFDRPAVLKIDCENKTFDAIRSLGTKILKFDVINVEIVNHQFWSMDEDWESQQSEILTWMLGWGFKCRIVSTWFNYGTIPVYDICFYRK